MKRKAIPLIMLALLMINSIPISAQEPEIIQIEGPPEIPPPEGSWDEINEQYTTSSSIKTWKDHVGTGYGFDLYLDHNDDWHWWHKGFNPSGKIIIAVIITIRAWDVDWPFELDKIKADGKTLGYLSGFNNRWSTSIFSIPNSKLDDGEVKMEIDIDSGYWCKWVCIWPFPCKKVCSADWNVKLDYAELLVTYLEVAPPEAQPVADADGIDDHYDVYEGIYFMLDARDSTDATSYRWTIDGLWDSDWSSDPTATTIICDDYQGTVTLEVKNVELKDTDTATITVHNVEPSVIAGPDQTVILCNDALLVGQFTDPGMCDTHTVRWDFGDGTPPEQYQITKENVTEIVNTTHYYSAAGTYNVKLEVEDDDEGVGVDYLTVVVESPTPAPLFSDVLWIFPAGIIASVLLVRRQRRKKLPIAN